MSRFLYLSFFTLLGCPVEPKDIQDLNTDPGPGKPANGEGGNPGGNMGGNPSGNMGGNPGGNMGGNPGGNMGGNPDGNMGGNPDGNMGGTPPGAPNIDGGNMAGPLPQGEGVEGQPPMQDGDIVPGLPKDGQNLDGGNAENTEGTPMGDGVQSQFEDTEKFTGKQGEVETPQDKHPTPDFEHQPGSIPATAGDVLPIYQQPPSFDDFIGEEQITITLEVIGATTFDYEFVVEREGEGRSYPKVIHKQSNATSPFTVQAPSTMDEPIWLVITADKTGDGPTPDDLVGGTETAITFAGKDLSLSYTLNSDESFMQNLPWFSQVQGGPEFER